MDSLAIRAFLMLDSGSVRTFNVRPEINFARSESRDYVPVCTTPDQASLDSGCVGHQGELAMRQAPERGRHEKDLVVSFESECFACP